MSAVSARGAPADPVCLDDGYGVAPFGEGEGGRDSGEPATDDADIRRLAAFQRRVMRDFVFDPSFASRTSISGFLFI
jgi:hypothetical protein